MWCWLRGEDRGELLHRSRALAHRLAPAFRLDQTIDAFRYKAGFDLTGYEDGTENPKGEAAVAAAVAVGLGPGLDGGSYVAVQQWVHDSRSLRCDAERAAGQLDRTAAQRQ